MHPSIRQHFKFIRSFLLDLTSFEFYFCRMRWMHQNANNNTFEHQMKIWVKVISDSIHTFISYFVPNNVIESKTVGRESIWDDNRQQKNIKDEYCALYIHVCAFKCQLLTLEQTLFDNIFRFQFISFKIKIKKRFIAAHHCSLLIAVHQSMLKLLWKCELWTMDNNDSKSMNVSHLIENDVQNSVWNWN